MPPQRSTSSLIHKPYHPKMSGRFPPQAPLGAKGNSPGQGTLKVCRSPGITPLHQQALKGRQKTRVGIRDVFHRLGLSPVAYLLLARN